MTAGVKWDVTGTVPVTDSRAVFAAVCALIHDQYPQAGVGALDSAFMLHDRIYDGLHPDYHACETGYHDKRHVLDVTLAAARLMHGHEQAQPPEQRLGVDLMRIGVLAALFHDVGYIRHRSDRLHRHGAELTQTHVSRGADFLADLLPTLGLEDYSKLGRWLVHYTGYEMAADEIPVPNAHCHRLGCLIGTADVVAQMANDDYLEKCRDDLYTEFQLAGVAVTHDADGQERVLYSSGEDLLKKTPAFMAKTLHDRLEQAFGGCYRWLEAHFDGKNPYMEAIEANRQRIQALIDSHR